MRLDTLRAAVDTVVPEDEWPAGWDGGVAVLLERDGDAVLGWAEPLLARVAGRLGSSFGRLDVGARSAALANLATEDPAAFGALLRVSYEGYYGSHNGFEPRSWEMIGFRPLGSAREVVELDPVPTVGVDGVRDAYDVVVVGAGAGGGVTAAVLAEAGLDVLLVERARAHTNAELRGDHLHGKRASLYSPTAGPGLGHPRVLEDAGGTRVVDCATEPFAWGLNAMALGGGTRLWQGVSWRFMAEDFEMATRYGVPEGSSLADWPIGYADLAPYYDLVEWEIGVCGQSDGPLVERRRAPGPTRCRRFRRTPAGRRSAPRRTGWGGGQGRCHTRSTASRGPAGAAAALARSASAIRRPPTRRTGRTTR